MNGSPVFTDEQVFRKGKMPSNFCIHGGKEALAHIWDVFLGSYLKQKEAFILCAEKSQHQRFFIGFSFTYFRDKS